MSKRELAKLASSLIEVQPCKEKRPRIKIKEEEQESRPHSKRKIKAEESEDDGEEEEEEEEKKEDTSKVFTKRAPLDYKKHGLSMGKLVNSFPMKSDMIALQDTMAEVVSAHNEIRAVEGKDPIPIWSEMFAQLQWLGYHHEKYMDSDEFKSIPTDYADRFHVPRFAPLVDRWCQGLLSKPTTSRLPSSIPPPSPLAALIKSESRVDTVDEPSEETKAYKTFVSSMKSTFKEASEWSKFYESWEPFQKAWSTYTKASPLTSSERKDRYGAVVDMLEGAASAAFRQPSSS